MKFLKMREPGMVIIRISRLNNVKQITSYFGFMLSSKDIFDEVKVSKKVSIRFYKNESLLNEQNIIARIFRPLIEVVSASNEIIFEKNKKSEIPLSLRYRGFGDIHLGIRGESGGRIVTKRRMIGRQPA